MKNLLLIVVIFVIGCFLSCSFVRNEQIIDKYYISAVDLYNEPCLVYKLEDEYQICIVPSKVLEYCKNEKYIFVKQVPSGVKNTENINYYIVPILKGNPSVFPDSTILGPLSEQKFNKEIVKMNLLEIKFKKIR